MPLRLKLALSYLLIGLIPVLAMAFVVYQQASEALRVQTLNALEAGKPLASLSAYSDVLKTLTPGQAVPIVFEHEGKKVSATVTLTAR